MKNKSIFRMLITGLIAGLFQYSVALKAQTANLSSRGPAAVKKTISEPWTKTTTNVPEGTNPFSLRGIPQEGGSVMKKPVSVPMVPEPKALIPTYTGTIRPQSDIHEKQPESPAPIPPGRPLQAGDNISNAFEIASIPFTATGTTCGFINDYDAVCPFTGSTAPDVVFKFESMNEYLVSISLCNASYDSKLYIYEDAYSATPYACNDDYCGATGWQSKLFGISFRMFHTYYIVVDGYQTSCGNYDLRITQDLTCPPGAIPEGEPMIPDEGTDVTNGGCTITPNLFTPISPGQTVCGLCNTYKFGSSDYRDTDWYVLDLTSATDSTLIRWEVIAEFSLHIYILDIPGGDCNNQRVLASDYAQPGSRAIATARVMPGIYYVWVSIPDFTGYPANGGPYMYVASLSAGPILVNDFCANAMPVGETGSLYYSTEFATLDGTGAYSNGPNLWYNYTAGFTGNAIVSLCGSTFDTKLAVYDGTGCNPLGTSIIYNDDACGLQSQVTLLVEDGYTYKIEVGSFGAATGTGYLAIHPDCIHSCLPGTIPEDEPAIPDEGTDVTNGGCNFTPNLFTPANLGNTYCGQANTYTKDEWNNRDTDWYLLNLLDFIPPMKLYWQVQSEFAHFSAIIDGNPLDCGYPVILSSSSADICGLSNSSYKVYNPGTYVFFVAPSVFYGLPPEAPPYYYYASLVGVQLPPDNDNCANSTPIGEVQDLVFYTNFATHDGPGSCIGSENIWFNYTPSESGEVTISTCGSEFNTKLAVYLGNGCPAPGTLLACNDDYCGTSSQISMSVYSGQHYIVEVGGYTMGCQGKGYLNIHIGPQQNATVRNFTLWSGQDACFDAIQTLSVNNLSVLSGGSVSLIAGQKIMMSPGILVYPGGYLHGTITETDSYCGTSGKALTEAGTKSLADEKVVPTSGNPPLFSVHPNPTTGLFTLEMNHDKPTREAVVRIYDMLGNLILREQLTSSGKKEISLDGKPAGIYHIRVSTADETGTVRLIKQQ